MIIDVCTFSWKGASPWFSLRGGGAGGVSGVGPTGTESVRSTVADAAILLGYASNHLNIHIPFESVASRVAEDDRICAGFAGIDPLDEAAGDHLASALELGASGVVVSPADQDCRPTNERFMDLMSECEKRDLPVMVTNPGLRCAASRLEYANPALLDEAALAFPRLTMVLGELRVHPEHALLMLARHENVFAETSTLVGNPSALHHALLSAHHTGVTDKFLFGSGAPLTSADVAVQRIFSINKLGADPGVAVPREKLRAIVERDALERLNLQDATTAIVRAHGKTTEHRHAASVVS